MKNETTMPKTDVTEIFGSNVFNDSVMKERLPKGTYNALKQTIEQGLPLQRDVAEVVANAMKDWAIEKGATHFTHWFQPMTGITAEKHESFISPAPGDKVIMEFSGKELIKGEPDASSFPSGGLRATFEARGYTVWDCTSPAFLKEDPSGVTLYIPTAFCSYTGEALDTKTPLLRSVQTLSEQTMRILKLFGNTTSKRVIPTVGPEQEYFLVDRDLYNKRKDLMFTGRTLFGAKPPKGQEMEDHYFGSLKERVSAFMKEIDIELWKLGVFAKTKHNEVAPSQHELAPIFSNVNVAVDHNQLTMDIMKKVAQRQGLACLLHEKPFAGVNGSGKHNNWSISTDDGLNLLEPGKTPHDNTQFLLFLCAVIKAVDEYSELIRLSAASAGNDHRLGGNEAPPAIVSMFLGEQLTDVLEQIESGDITGSKQGGRLDVGVSTLYNVHKDSTDRNRTSPFAFTGNKFEFRMVPSSGSISDPNVVINTIVAEELSIIADKLENCEDFDNEVQEVIKDIVKKHKRIIFNGDGYSEEWVKEAEKRGLPNITSTVQAIPAWIAEKSIKLFEKHKVFSEVELHSRYEIALENYVKQINIEALTMIDMAEKDIFPAVNKYINEIAQSIRNVQKVIADACTSPQEDKLKKLLSGLKDFNNDIEKLKKVLAEASECENDNMKQAALYRNKVFAAMAKLRDSGDALEEMMDSELWPMPTYGELLFGV